MTHPAVARTEPRGMGRHGDRDHSAGAHDPPRFTESGDVVGHVLDHLAEYDCVEAGVGERKLGDVGSDHGPAHPSRQNIAGRFRNVAADDVEASVFQQPREGPAPGAGVEDRSARPRSQHEVEQEALTELVAGTDEVGSVSPALH